MEIFIYSTQIYTVMREITLRDYKILSELDKNPKLSYNQIGRKLRLSPSVVERRIKNLIKNRIIKAFLSIINYKKLGYTYYSIYAKFHNINEEKREQIYEYLKQHPLSGQILRCDGRWQLIYGFFAKDIFHLNEELQKFNDLFGENIGETEKIIHIGSHHYYRGYLINKETSRPSEPFLGGRENLIDLDKKDLKLLNLIRSNARISLVDLAENIKISVDQIRYKLKKLNHENILMGYWLHLNPKNIGLQFYRILLKLKNIDNKAEDQLLTFLNINKNVIRSNRVFGSWDLFIDMEISTEDFRKFLDFFLQTFSDQIQEYETLMIYEETKFTFSPLF